jgi:cytidine deaminase
LTTDSDLLEAAQHAAGHAYCPYSNFPVGAVVLAADGRLFEGANVENASFGLAICAERVAIFNAVAAGARELRKLALACPKASSDSLSLQMPCGACRQVMAEFMSPDTEIIVDRAGSFRLDALLPRPFRLNRAP